MKLFLDTGLLASGTVTVNAGTPGADDTLAALFPDHVLPVGTTNDLLSLVITTAGGITIATTIAVSIITTIITTTTITATA